MARLFLQLSLGWTNTFVKIQKGVISVDVSLQSFYQGSRSLLLGYWIMEPVSTALLCRRHRARGYRRSLGLSRGRSFLLLKWIFTAAQGGDHAVAELLVHADVDHWVVDGWTLGKEGRDGHEEWSEFSSLIAEDPPGRTGIGKPRHQEGNDHHYYHPADFPLSPLGGLRLLLGSSSLFDSTE